MMRASPPQVEEESNFELKTQEEGETVVERTQAIIGKKKMRMRKRRKRLKSPTYNVDKTRKERTRKRKGTRKTNMDAPKVKLSKESLTIGQVKEYY